MTIAWLVIGFVNRGAFYEKFEYPVTGTVTDMWITDTKKGKNIQDRFVEGKKPEYCNNPHFGYTRDSDYNATKFKCDLLNPEDMLQKRGKWNFSNLKRKLY